jgi:O-succinylbenzoic acid--CoA ligase
VTREPIDWPTTDLLTGRLESTPGRTALVDADRDEQWSYRQLHGRIGRAATSLTARGVEPGDTVGLLLTTGIPFVDLFHAAMRLRATLVPVNVELPTAELAPQAARAGLDWLVCESDTDAAAVDLVDPERVLSVHDDPIQEGVRPLGRPTNALGERDPVDRDWTQLIVFTSGTTGDPKGVRLTAGNLVASARASAARLGVDPGDRWLVCLPTYHMGGLAPVFSSALYGTAVVLQREFDAETTRRVIDGQDVTGVSLVPTMLVRLLDAGWTPPEHLRFVLLGGAPAPEELIARCEERSVPVYPTYGTTETASQVATAAPDEAFEYERTVGKPLECTEVTVVDGGAPVPAGESGELVVDGTTVTPGYLDEARTEAAFGEHGLHTGDVGYQDGSGRLWVLGRLDDVVVTGGENVNSEQVADVVREHPGVEDAAVVGLEDPEWGERVAALLVGDVDAAAVEAHCRERLAGFAVPKTWGTAAELPRTPSGTVDRETVRARLRDG